MTRFHSFLWLSNVPLCTYTTSLSIHPLKDTSWLWKIMLQWTWGCIYLFELLFTQIYAQWLQFWCQLLSYILPHYLFCLHQGKFIKKSDFLPFLTMVSSNHTSPIGLGTEKVSSQCHLLTKIKFPNWFPLHTLSALSPSILGSLAFYHHKASSCKQ